MDLDNNYFSTPKLELTDWIWYQFPIEQKNYPSPRQMHTGVVFQDHWYIFGGYAKRKPLDELWRFSLVRKEWRQINKISSKWPKARHSHTLTLKSSTKGANVDSMIVFGGVTENGELLNDIWEYSFNKSTWNKLQTENAPSPRWGHSAVMYENELWVFGGFTDTWTNELYSLNFASMKWTKVTAEGAPSARQFHSAHIYHDTMYIFAGLNTKNLGDMKRFRFASQTWENVETINSISARRGQQSMLFDHYLVVHGGRSKTENCNDLNFFDLGSANAYSTHNVDTNTWQTIQTDSTAPTARYCHSMCFWQNNIVVFGGFGLRKDALPTEQNGRTKLKNLNDLYYFSFKGNIFTDINSINGYFAQLPLDILRCCLEFCEAHALYQLALVNRFFYTVSSANYLWKRVLQNKLKEQPPNASGYSKQTWDTLESQYSSHSKDNQVTKLNDLLSATRTKLKPDITQYFWKYQYACIYGSREGFSRKPYRDPKIMESAWNDLDTRNPVKIVIFGEGGVGKSTTALQYVYHKLYEDYDPTLEDSYRKVVRIPGRTTTVTTDIFDTASSDCYDFARQEYMRIGHGFIIMFDLRDSHSFDRLVPYIDSVCREQGVMSKDVPMVLVGNKCDLDKPQVIREQLLEVANKYDYPVFEASAKFRINTNQIFDEILKETVYKRHQASPEIKKKKEGCIVQ